MVALAELGKSTNGFLLDGVIEVEVANGDLLVGDGVIVKPKPVLRSIVPQSVFVGVFLLLQDLDGGLVSLSHEQSVQFGMRAVRLKF